jgi:hypothetical protein
VLHFLLYYCIAKCQLARFFINHAKVQGRQEPTELSMLQVAAGVCEGLGIDYSGYMDDELVGGSSEDETVYRFAGASP